jgi:hypothetical protein
MTRRTARLYCSPTAAHQRAIMGGLCEAMRRDGWDAQVARSRDYVPSDLAVFWGHRQQVIIEHQRKIGGDYLVCERGYVGDRFYWTSLGFNGLNGRADFANEYVPGDRWERYYADQLQPVRSGGDYALLIGQVPGDAALVGLPGNTMEPLIKELRACIPRTFGMPVRYRPHPQVGHSDTTLEQDLERAAVCVTWNSNSGVISALHGVPTVTLDPGAMAWPVAAHELQLQPLADRTEWCHRIAYAQWSPDEIVDGSAWKHLRRRYFDS